MHNLAPSVYDFPSGYPDFESIKKEAFDILKSGSYIDAFLDGRPQVVIEKLRRRVKNTNSNWAWNEHQYFFPISELFLQNRLPLEEIQKAVNALFISLAKDSLGYSFVQEADHIPGTFFLAWWIKNKLFSERELKKIRFDHDDEKWDYYGQKYVESYGCSDINSIVQKIAEDITLPERIEQKIQQNKEDKERTSRFLQENINGRSMECLCC